MTEDELLKLRFDFAWKHFEYHARQRIFMFNFFLVVTGILANSYVALLRLGLHEIAVGLGFLGFLFSLSFFALDWRNTQLAMMGQYVLLKLEKDDIFKEFNIEKEAKSVQLGVLLQEEKQ